MKIHPAAELFPMMQGASFESFKESIQRQGQLEPAKFYKGQLLDGRNRLKACEELSIDLLSVDVTVDDPIAYVVAENLERRHLTTQQRAAIAAEMANMVHGSNRYEKKVDGSNDPSTISNEDAAQIMGVSASSVKRAKKTMADDPVAHNQAKQGIKKKPVKKEKKKTSHSWYQIAQQEGVLSVNCGGSEATRLKEDLRGINPAPELLDKDHAAQLKEACIFLRIQRDPGLTGKLELEAKQACESLQQAEEKQVDKAIRLARKHIEYEIQTRVTEQLQSILPMYKKKAEEYDRIKKAYKGVLTNTEFKKLLAFLHSDRHQDDLMKKKADVLFKLIKGKEDLLCQAKSNGNTGSLPDNVADLMAMRKTKA